MVNHKISKPRTKINTTKSSDRRLAATGQAASYLLSNQNMAKGLHRGNLAAIGTGSSSSVPAASINSNKTVIRSNGNQKWEDKSLLEWDPKHFRLFVGNLGPDATDDLLLRSFGKYESLSKVKVPIDNKTGKNKGFGFVAFANSQDYMKAFKEMNGKYVGQHPVMLKRAETTIKPVKKRK